MSCGLTDNNRKEENNMSKKILCTDGIERTEKQYGKWLLNLQELAEQEPEDLTDEELEALQQEGLWY